MTGRWPAEENCEHVSFLSTPLPRLLLTQREQIEAAEQRARDAEARYERLDEALALFEWVVAHDDRGHMGRFELLAAVGEVAQRGATGQSADWMPKVRKIMEGS